MKECIVIFHILALSAEMNFFVCHSTHTVPFDRRLAKKKKFQAAKAKEAAKPILGKIEITPKAIKEQTLRLCNGEDLRPLSVRKNLQCKYVHRNIPYYRYGPRKVEVVNLKPYIAIMHDFIMVRQGNLATLLFLLNYRINCN